MYCAPLTAQDDDDETNILYFDSKPSAPKNNHCVSRGGIALSILAVLCAAAAIAIALMALSDKSSCSPCTPASSASDTLQAAMDVNRSLLQQMSSLRASINSLQQESSTSQAQMLVEASNTSQVLRGELEMLQTQLLQESSRALYAEQMLESTKANITAPAPWSINASSCLDIANACSACQTGQYWISVNAMNISVFCLLDCPGPLERRGWTLISYGGRQCGNSEGPLANVIGLNTLYTEHGSLSSGFMAEPIVRALAQNSSAVMIMATNDASLAVDTTQAWKTWSAIATTSESAVSALRTKSNWNAIASPGISWTNVSLSSSWQWCFDVACACDCSPSSSLWPNLYHSCCCPTCVHWFIGDSQYYFYQAPVSVQVALSATWII